MKKPEVVLTCSLNPAHERRGEARFDEDGNVVSLPLNGTILVKGCECGGKWTVSGQIDGRPASESGKRFFLAADAVFPITDGKKH